jgi:DNA helicase-2/ATP-dependent DNA helicase PcrA
VERRYRLASAPSSPASALDLERTLNAAQRAAVESDAPRILILAGAGTGKTRTLTYRVARLIEKGVPPSSIVLATFTNRAAKEMVERIELLLGPLARQVRAGTFHSLAYRALRRWGSAFGFDERLAILARDDQKELMGAAVADAEIEVAARRFPSAEALVELASLAINTGCSITEVLTQKLSLLPFQAEIERVLARYAERKAAMNAMDFDDLLHFWRKLLLSGEAAERIKDGVGHVLVDEFQDTNRLQADIAELLSEKSKNLCVVGDDAQSIFAFRGARFDNILEFPRARETQIHSLTDNYRSTQKILALANEVIAQNPLQFPKALSSPHAGSVVPVVVPAKDLFQQAEFVAQRVLELVDEGLPLAEQAVLYRSHGQSVELQLELTKRNVPYLVRSGRRFFEQAHVRDLLAFLRIIWNPKDELAWRRVLAILPGVGARSSGRIWSWIAQAIDGRRDHLEALLMHELLLGLPARARASIRELVEMLRIASSEEMQARPGELIRTLLRVSLVSHLEQVHANANARTEELLQLADIAAQSKDLGAFLQEIALVNEIAGEEMAGGSRSKDREWLTLSTVHQAKGLEWRAVFVAGLTDGGFPHQQSLEEPGGEAEERRLFYVAVTRAKEQLYLVYPGSRIVRDQDRVLTRPSRFVSSIPPGLIEKWVLDQG